MSALDRLRPHPVRGDTIAAGAVPLSVAAFAIDTRMTQWGVGARFGVEVLIAALILTMGWLAPLEHAHPRWYHSTLLVAGLLPLTIGFLRLAEVLGAARPPGPGAVAWTFGAVAVLGAVAARRANSAACTLVAALAGAVATEAFIQFAFHPTGLGTFRAFLVLLVAAFAYGVVRLRDRHRRHAVALVNAAGLMGVALAFSYNAYTIGLRLVIPAASLDVTSASPAAAPFGWKLSLFVLGAALLAYAGADGERGPALLGIANLAGFAWLVGLPGSGGGSIVGWPLFLIVLGGAGLAIGLRPMQPLPPEPPVRPLPPEPPEPPTRPLPAEPPTEPMSPPEEPA